MAKSNKSPGKQKPLARSRRREAAPNPGSVDPALPSVEELDLPPLTPVEVNPPVVDPQASLVVASGARPKVGTIIYVHGIGNKPPPAILKCQWDSALFGVQLGDRSRMAYWVNRVFYPRPLDDTCGDRDTIQIDDDEVSTKAVVALAARHDVDEREAIEAEIEALTMDQDTDTPEDLKIRAARRTWLRHLAAKMIDQADPPDAVAAAGVQAKILPLPPPSGGSSRRKSPARSCAT